MENLPYLLKASIGVVVFYGLYWLVLRRHTYFAFNRFYLLTALFLSLVAPLIELPTEPLPVVEADVSTYSVLPNVGKYLPSGVQSLSNVEQPFNWLQLCWLLYGIGVAAMAIRFVSQLIGIFRIIKKSERFAVDSQTIALTPDGAVPTFSFFKWLVINPKDYEKYFDTVLRHETIHAQQGHSFDLVLAEIVQIVLWFNPVLIFYKRSLCQIHEYLADDQTDTTDRQHYAQKLFGYVFQVEAIPLTNSFLDSSTLKNRIKMLYQKRSSRWVLGRYLLALPLLGLLITLVAARVATPTDNVLERITVRGQVITQDGKGLPGVTVVVKNGNSGSSTDIRGNFIINVEKGQTLVFTFVGYKAEEREIRKEKMTVMMEQEPKQLSEIVVVGNTDIPPPPPPPPTPNEDEVFTVVEQQPEYVGGNGALMQFLARNIKYPATAARANVEGMVFLTFEISKTGQVSNIKILKGIGFGCDEEAIRVASLMPAWRPGRQNGKPVAVKYNLPIRFLLEKSTKRTSKITSGVELVPQPNFKVENLKITNEPQTKIVISPSNSTMFGGERPLYVVDGEIAEGDNKFEGLKPEDIKTISIVKGDEASKLYGFKGKNGVVVIETKKGERFMNYKLHANFLDKNPVYLLGDKEITKDEMEKLNPDDIAAVDVLKGDAIVRYGEKGKNGVVIITLKKKKE